MVVAVEELHRDLQAKAEYASVLSQQVEAFKKELGNARKAADRVPEIEAERDVAKAALVEANGKIKSLEASLASASACAAKGDAAIAAGKAIADGLKQLGAL